MPGPLLVLNHCNFYYAFSCPQISIQLSNLIFSSSWYIFAFLFLGYAFLLSYGVCLIPLSWYLCVMWLFAWFQTVSFITAPGLLISQLPHFQTPGLSIKHRTHLKRQELILFVFQVQTRALTIGCPLGPECDFRIPMLNLNIPNTVLAQGPFHFPAQLCGSEAMPEHFARPVSDSWQILVSSERSCREQDLS